MNKELPIFSLDIFPLPGEMITITVDEKFYKGVVSHLLKSDNFFGVYNEHKKNIKHYGVEMEIVGVTPKKESRKRKIYAKAISLFQIKSLSAEADDQFFPIAEVRDDHQWRRIKVGREIQRDLMDYLLNTNQKLFRKMVSRKDFSLFEIVKILKLNATEKFQLLHLKNLSEVLFFLINTLRFRSVLHRQKKSISLPLYLN